MHSGVRKYRHMHWGTAVQYLVNSMKKLNGKNLIPQTSEEIEIAF